MSVSIGIELFAFGGRLGFPPPDHLRTSKKFIDHKYGLKSSPPFHFLPSFHIGGFGNGLQCVTPLAQVLAVH
jgi:hypothetical protein